VEPPRTAAEAGFTGEGGPATPWELVVRAPGKAFIVGEYAVVYGGEAVVAAVARYAHARLARGPRPELSPFLAELCARFAPPPGTYPVVDTRELAAADGMKLGLGSSAAATVAAAGVMRARVGCDLDDAEERRTLLDLCVAAHRAAQGGRGSGADVAASIYGGLARVARRAGRLAVEPATLAPGLRLLFFGLGAPASTIRLVSLVDEIPEGRRLPLIARLGAATELFAHARQVEALRESHRALIALGDAAGAEIVPPSVRALADVAERLGGAAKTSGAGGGDLAVALVPEESAGALLAATRLSPLPLAIDHGGVTIEP
jgi:phosphomevalonate kinase